MSLPQPAGNLKLALIAYARKTPLIWNKNISCTKKEREDAWTSFADGFNLPVEEVRKRWEGIRRMYCHELKAVLNEGTTSDWYYFSKLDAFLRGPIENILLKEGSISSDKLLRSIDLSSDDDTIPCSPKVEVGETAVSSSQEVNVTPISSRAQSGLPDPTQAHPLSETKQDEEKNVAKNVLASPQTHPAADLTEPVIKTEKDEKLSWCLDESAAGETSSVSQVSINETNPSKPNLEPSNSQPKSVIAPSVVNVPVPLMDIVVKKPRKTKEGGSRSALTRKITTNILRFNAIRNRIKSNGGQNRPKSNITGRLTVPPGSGNTLAVSAKARLAAKCGEMIPLRKETTPAPEKKHGMRWVDIDGKPKVVLLPENQKNPQIQVQPHKSSAPCDVPKESNISQVGSEGGRRESAQNEGRVQSSGSRPVHSASDESKLERSATVNATFPPPQAVPSLERLPGVDQNHSAPLRENPQMLEDVGIRPVPRPTAEVQVVEMHAFPRPEPEVVELFSPPRPVPEDKEEEEEELPSSTKPAAKGLEWIQSEIDEWRGQINSSMDRLESAAETDSEGVREARKNFLLSFLPDMSEMTVEQRRFFKSKLMYLICNIDQFS